MWTATEACNAGVEEPNFEKLPELRMAALSKMGVPDKFANTLAYDATSMAMACMAKRESLPRGHARRHRLGLVCVTRASPAMQLRLPLLLFLSCWLAPATAASPRDAERAPSHGMALSSAARRGLLLDLLLETTPPLAGAPTPGRAGATLHAAPAPDASPA